MQSHMKQHNISVLQMDSSSELTIDIEDAYTKQRSSQIGDWASHFRQRSGGLCGGMDHDACEQMQPPFAAPVVCSCPSLLRKDRGRCNRQELAFATADLHKNGDKLVVKTVLLAAQQQSEYGAKHARKSWQHDSEHSLA